MLLWMWGGRAISTFETDTKKALFLRDGNLIASKGSILSGDSLADFQTHVV